MSGAAQQALYPAQPRSDDLNHISHDESTEANREHIFWELHLVDSPGEQTVISKAEGKLEVM